MTHCVAEGHVGMFEQWVAGVGQVFIDGVLGLVIGSGGSKAAWRENQTDGISSCTKPWNPSLSPQWGSDFSDRTLGLCCRWPDMEKRTQHLAVPGIAIALHMRKSANTYLVLPLCKALDTSLIFFKASQYLLNIMVSGEKRGTWILSTIRILKNIMVRIVCFMLKDN